MVYPLKDSFTIENGLLFVQMFLYFDVTLPFRNKTCHVNIYIQKISKLSKNLLNTSKISVPTEHFDQFK